jgi:hypothetical protein
VLLAAFEVAPHARIGFARLNRSLKAQSKAVTLRSRVFPCLLGAKEIFQTAWQSVPRDVVVALFHVRKGFTLPRCGLVVGGPNLHRPFFLSEEAAASRAVPIT